MATYANKDRIFRNMRNIAIGCFWLGLIILCFVYRDKITVEGIVNFTPENTVLAIFIMLVLFALKSVTFFVYGGLLYTASGIIFPLPVAILVNLMGTAVMTSIPFFIGKRLGTKIIDGLTEKHPKMKILKSITNKNEVFVSFFLRIVGCIPSDPLGIYLGASGIRYSRYLCGTLLGLLSAMVSFSVMGMSINDVTSPAFIISAAVEIGLMILSVVLYLIWREKNKRNQGLNNQGGKTDA